MKHSKLSVDVWWNAGGTEINWHSNFAIVFSKKICFYSKNVPLCTVDTMIDRLNEGIAIILRQSWN